MNTDPRRPDKIQRYVPAKNNANGEDLTPDYMNIMGQPAATTANATGEAATAAPKIPSNPAEERRHEHNGVPTSAANVIPTSPQYGVAIIPANENASELTGDPSQPPRLPPVTADTPTVDRSASSQAVSRAGEQDSKDVVHHHHHQHVTPSRNERFKVVKIASLEPFKRGRWKCMDYVDEAPPPNVLNAGAKAAQAASAATAPPITGGVYLQTQSLPQQQIQQMLLQGGQFFPNVPAQLIPQGQYFYQAHQVQPAPPHHQPIPAQFINNQPFYPAGVVAAANPTGFAVPQSYPNIQYVPIPAQGSAFVPASSQAMHNFQQQSQSYSGQPTAGSQTGISPGGMVNGHAYPEQPNQPAKNVIVQQPQQNNHQQPAAQSAPVITTQQQQYQQQGQSGSYQPQPQQQQQQQQQQFQPQNVVAPVATTVLTQQQQQQQQAPPQQQQNFDASSVYTNPQFTMSVSSLTALEGGHENNSGGGGGVASNNLSGSPAPVSKELKDSGSAVEMSVGESQEDSSKNNPVVNAIDNKIEQAMDLVKSHLMYTVREEVEVLKEKIAELMERIQQLETENNYLRSQIPPPKSQTTANNNNHHHQHHHHQQQQQQQQQQQNIAAVNVLPQNSANPIVGGTASNPPAQQQQQQQPPPPPPINNGQTIPASNVPPQNEAVAAPLQ